MLKTLLKKQLLEFVSGFLSKNTEKKKQGKGSKAVIIGLFIFAFISFMMMFFSMAFMLSGLTAEGGAWLYFSVFGILASLMGIMGSVFMTYNTLFEAKDNDMLLSMPIPSWMILFSRMAGLYLTAFFFEAMVFIPAVIIYFITSPIKPLPVILCIVNIFVLPLFAISISFVLGWVIAFFASKLRNKSIITVVFSLVFFAVYYFCAMRLNEIINMIMTNTEIIGEWIKKYLNPIYRMGLGCAGDFFSYVIFLVFVCIVFSVIYIIASHSFIKLATAKKGMKKIKYKEKLTARASVKAAFLKKEFLFFKNTPIYILNCALGSLILLIVAVFSAVRHNDLIAVLALVPQFGEDSLPCVLAVAVCFVASMNNMTSVSVSLEGKSLWFLKSVPADVKNIFFGKLMLHILVTGVPLLIADIIISTAFGFGFTTFILFTLFTEVFMILCAETGLMVNLIFPKTDWLNEASAVKQSISALIGMFAGMFYSILVILSFYLLSAFTTPIIFFISVTAVFLLLTALIYKWLTTAGIKRFMAL